MIMDMLEKTERFAREVGSVDIPETPQRLGMQGKLRALELFREELSQFEDATELHREAESLIEMAYLAFGRIIEMGLPPKALFEEVHEAGALVRDPDLRTFLSVGRESALRASWKPKLLIIGHAGHGKSTVCTLLRSRYGMSFAESSQFCAANIIMPYFDSIGQGYQSVEECFADRINHRWIWFNLIREYNSSDATTLAREILDKFDVYSGMRSADELITCKQAKLFDHIVWVDRSEHAPVEPASSCTVLREMANYVIDNNGTEQQLVTNVHSYVTWLYGRHMVNSLMREQRASK